MATLERLTVDQVLYTVRRERAGSTVASRIATNTVRVLEIDLRNRRVYAVWNHFNPARWYSEGEVKKWRVSDPRKRPRDPQLKGDTP